MQEAVHAPRLCVVSGMLLDVVYTLLDEVVKIQIIALLIAMKIKMATLRRAN